MVILNFGPHAGAKTTKELVPANSLLMANKGTEGRIVVLRIFVGAGKP